MKKVTILLMILFGSCLLSFSQVDLYQFKTIEIHKWNGSELELVEQKDNVITGVFNANERYFKIVGKTTRVYALISQSGTESNTNEYGLFTTSIYNAIDWEGDECLLYFTLWESKEKYMVAYIFYPQFQTGFKYIGNYLN